MKVILAEKPSVARDIARVVGANQRKEGWLEGNGYQVTWAFGHLVTIVEPEVMCASWGGRWNYAQLPMIPRTFQLTTNPNSQSQFNTIKKLFNACTELINATDAGREGELIFRWIYKHSECNKPFQRLWISDLTDGSIKKGLQELHAGRNFDHLGDSAQCRAFADWMVGLNATRAYSISNNQLYTVGRVQTPTLALIVNRHKLINEFTKFYYYELYARVQQVPFRWENNEGYKIEKKDVAQQLKEKLSGEEGVITKIEKSKKKTSPLPLYDLTLLQKECNDKFGYTAQETLDYAQKLYEHHKLITYPRTESRHLSEQIRPQLPHILKNAPDNLMAFAEEALQRLKEGHKLGKGYIDDKKLTDHHAIIPTSKKLNGHLESHLNNIYMLIQRRFIAIFHDYFIEDVTEITMEIDHECFKFKGSSPVNMGWRRIYQKNPSDPYLVREEVKGMLKAQFKKGQKVGIDLLEVQEKETSPPKPFTDGTLLNAMRYIGRQVDDESLALQLKSQGLGTQATRASIIERLIKSKYIYRKGKNLLPTEKGIQLINIVVTDLKSPELTAQWEQKLSEIQEGRLKDSVFMEEIQNFIKQIIPIIQSNAIPSRQRVGTCPQCKKGTIYEGKKSSYYCSRYREGCKFVLWGMVASKKLNIGDIQKIIKDGRSNIIKGFKSKSGRSFDAAIILNAEFQTKFCFNGN